MFRLGLLNPGKAESLHIRLHRFYALKQASDKKWTSTRWNLLTINSGKLQREKVLLIEQVTNVHRRKLRSEGVRILMNLHSLLEGYCKMCRVIPASGDTGKNLKVI